VKRIVIPDWEKEKGMIWVEYPVCDASPDCNLPVFFKTQAIAELKILQEKN